ncbi:hypothetical protein [Cohnella terricola]|uniref:Plastocyanin n=1 Tax=Cohnella terricola TaxID=1289167 RepID=A0A559JTV8_9BACL|nr:hypothetical protein [Cohnella terricola]TVY03309.1 hypothetical protein FPZ45_05400 [Cohnella terricola]
MKRKVIALFLIVAAAFMLANGVFAAENAGSETWNVSVGKDTDSTALDDMFPRVVYIHEGDKVVFTNGAKINPHTVTFLGDTTTPLTTETPNFFMPSADSGSSWGGKGVLNSGILLPGGKYEFVFTASGAFPYYCVLHPMMNGMVVVVPKDQPIPGKVEQAAAAKAQEDDLRLQAQLLDGPSTPLYFKNKDGSLTYKVSLGTAHTTMSHNRMVPGLVVVSEGDSVEWTNQSPYEPHWVTFNKPADVEFLLEEGFNPVFMAQVGGNVLSGKEFTSSAPLYGDNVVYTLKFTKAGTYNYESYMQSDFKMKGTVVVVPKNAVKLVVNGKAVADSAQAQWKNGDLYVSIPAFAKALGGNSSVDNKAKTASIAVGSTAKAGKATKGFELTVFVNGKALQKAGYNVKGTAYVSAEEIVRALNGSYSWNEQTKTLTVTVGNSVNTEHDHH